MDLAMLAGVPLGLLMLVILAVLLVLVVLWIALPFALFGTKPLLRQLIAEQKRTNELLDRRLPQLRRPDSGGDMPPIIARRDE